MRGIYRYGINTNVRTSTDSLHGELEAQLHDPRWSKLNSTVKKQAKKETANRASKQKLLDSLNMSS